MKNPLLGGEPPISVEPLVPQGIQSGSLVHVGELLGGKVTRESGGGDRDAVSDSVDLDDETEARLMRTHGMTRGRTSMS